MRIKSVRIQNFRSFVDETIQIGPYTCFVGTNGAGKSGILCALNVFFREQGSSATDTTKLSDEDFFMKKTSEPIRITVHFTSLGDEAKAQLADYVRDDELVVTAEAHFDEQTRLANVQHFGQRLGMADFCHFFEAIKAGTSAKELGSIYDSLRERFAALPAVRSKEDRAEALRTYEAQHPTECVLIPSEDNFYGINSTGKLAKFVQWVYVPAVKDATSEEQEEKNSALGKLISRAVRSKTNFDKDLADLRSDTLQRYNEILSRNQSGLDDLSASLQNKLANWAHPAAKLAIAWETNADKSVALQQPLAGVRTGDGDFKGRLARMGHGLQRSYLLALLQELAGLNATESSTLILACEEPELYQHPPQARHLADVLEQLSEGNNQVLVTTHAPVFVKGQGFEKVRLVTITKNGSSVKGVTFEELCRRIKFARGEEWRTVEGVVAKIHQALQPNIAEIFFCRTAILVEGLEDLAYITSHLLLTGQWSEFRRLGCHIVPVGGKSHLLQPLALSAALSHSAFVVFDADGDTTKKEHLQKHEKDNKALFKLLDIGSPAFPKDILTGVNYTVWPNSLSQCVKADLGGTYESYAQKACENYHFENSLDKNELWIGDLLAEAFNDGQVSKTLSNLCSRIMEYAKT